MRISPSPFRDHVKELPLLVGTGKCLSCNVAAPAKFLAATITSLQQRCARRDVAMTSDHARSVTISAQTCGA
jgi:hypothetical protein